ncbi:MAG: GNAT family N-acetyltransferase, partial [Actinobacteria bacterium]
LPGVYAPPAGRLLVALAPDGSPAGVIGVRCFDNADPEVAEVKRLYVRPTARGAGLGRTLALAALDAARELGYREARLTTLPDSMDSALRMYRTLGFVESEPFYDHSHVADGTPMLYMRVALG